MRLHRLEATAFGPFADTVEVDLDELSHSGLFLLTGATGAGKTSVLDAVCFALYGDVPGDRGSARRLRSDQAAPGVRPRVELELTVAGRRLRLVRTPAWEREKKRGTGTTVEQASVVIAERVGSGADAQWRTLSTRLDETGHLIGGLLGMTLTQFTQVAMLPQGRFQAFLRARSEERHALLQQLFRTGRFEDVEGWLREHRKALRAESDEVQEQVADLASRISETALVDVPQSDTWPDGLAAWATATRTTAAADLTTATETLAAAVTGEREARAGLEAARSLHERRQRLERARREHDALVARDDEHHQQVEALAAARRAVPVLTVSRRLAGVARQVDAARARAEATSQVVTDHAGYLDAGDLDAPTLDAWAERLLAAAGAVRDALPRRQQLAEAEALLPALTAALEERRVEVSELETDAATLPTRAREAADRVTGLRARADLLPALRAAIESHQVAEELVIARADHLEARERAIGSHEALLAVREARIESMASELAGALAVGACCPVCGSAEHPAKARPGPGAADATAEREAQRRLDDDKSHEHLLAMHVRDLETRHALLLDRAREAELDPATTDLAALQARCTEAQTAVADLPAAISEVDALEQRGLESATVLEGARHREVLAREERTAVRRDIERLDAEVIAAGAAARRALVDDGRDPGTADLPEDPELPLGGRPDLTRLHSLLRERAAAVRDHVVALRELEAAVRAEEEAEVEAAEAATLAGFVDPQDAVAHALSEVEEQRLAHAVEQHRTRLAAVTEVLKDAGPRDDDALPDLAVLQRAHLDADADLTRARSRAATLTDRCTRLTDLVSTLEQLLARWDPIRRRLELATSVSAFVDGRSPDNVLAMRLSAYVLAWRLSQVVDAANERLARMSDQRYSLEHTGRRGAGETRGGLSLLVRDDWSGESRDPVTLSGGETFVVSLALALGLADVISHEAGGTELDTLFVDEGFGSLDADTLEDVMDTLDSLREGGRVVGVVSHVSEMRDRIPTQLHVTKGRAGSSVSLRRGA